MLTRWKSIVWSLLPLFALTIAFHRLILSPGSLLVDSNRPSLDHAGPPGSRGPGNDLTEVVLPRFENLKRLDVTGLWFPIPSWDDSGFGGRPRVGNPQSGSFYPPSWLPRWVGGPSAMTWLTLGHLAWAAAGTFLLSRSRGVSSVASAVAGTCFACSPYLIAHTFEGHYPHVWGVSWYPWALWAYIGVSRGRSAGYFVLPLVLALAFLTGHPQEWYLLGLILGGWTLAEALLRAARARHPDWLRIPLFLGLAFALSLAMCAVDLIPQLRASSWLLHHQRATLESTSHYCLRTANLFQLFSPFALGAPHDYFGRDNYWETLFSFGVLPLILAVAGVAGRGDRRLRLGFGLLGLLSAVFAAGSRLGLFSLVFLTIPGMSAFRVPARSLFMTSLAVAVLAGLGVDAIRDFVGSRVSTRSARRFCVVLVVLLILMSLITLFQGVIVPTKTDRAQSSMRAMSRIVSQPVAWGAILFAALMLSAPVLRRIGASWVSFALGVGASVEVALLASQVLIVSPADGYLQRPALTAAIREAGSRESSGPSRVASQPQFLTDLIAAREGISKSNLNDIFQLQLSADLYSELYPYLDPVLPLPTTDGPMDDPAFQFHQSLARTVLDLFGVRTIVTRDGVPLVGLEAPERFVDDRGPFCIQVNPTAMPWAYVVPGAIRNGDLGIPDEVFVTQINPRESVLMEEDPLPAGVRQPYTIATVVYRGGGRVELDLSTRHPGLLVVGNAWMPGWGALVDGAAAPVLRGNHWQQVVPIQNSGKHRVVLTYHPPGYQEGKLVSGLALMVWGVSLTAWCLGRTRRKGLSDPAESLTDKPFQHKNG